MVLPVIDLNWWAILVATVVAHIIGSVWYSPIGFGNAWMKLVGLNKKDMEKAKKAGMWKLYLASFVASLVTSYVLAHFVGGLGVNTFFDGVALGFWVWLGFFGATMLGMILWENKPWKLYWITTLYWLVLMMVSAGILAAW